MKFRLVLSCAVAALAICFANPLSAQLVVPNDYASTTGTVTFLGPLANSQRTYQLLIHQDQLTSVLNQQLTGLAFRLPANATDPWPAAGVTFNNYDIYLSGSVAPADRSLTFADNIVGPQTQVRSGELTIPAASFPSGGSPNNFGVNIAFNPYHYTGGHLLVEIRHTGFTGTSRTVDAIGTGIAGYGSQFSAAWTGNYNGVSGSQGNFSVLQFTSQPIPEPGVAGLLLAIGLAGFTRRRARK